MRISDLIKILKNFRRYKTKTSETATEYIFYKPVLIRERSALPEVLTAVYGDKKTSVQTKESKNNYNQIFVTIARMQDIASDILRNLSTNSLNRNDQNLADCAHFFELLLSVCQMRNIKIEQLDNLNARHKRGVFNNHLYMKYAEVGPNHPLLKKYESKSIENSSMKKILLSKLVRDNLDGYGFNYIVTNVGDFVHESLKDKYKCEINGKTVKIDMSPSSKITDGSFVFLYKLEHKSVIIKEFINKVIEEIKEASSALQEQREYFIQELSDVLCAFMRLIELLQINFYDMLEEIAANKEKHGSFSLMITKIAVDN